MTTPLTEWQNFYEILGAAAGSLTGLQFVAMALVAEIPLTEGETEAGEDANAAFSTPSIIHFSTVLFICAAGAMPWHSVTAAAIVWSIAGLVGLVYTAFVAWLLRQQSAYKPVLEDWLFRLCLPLAAYLTLAASAFIIHAAERTGLFAVAAVAIAFLFIGIHNAWDNVTYLVLMKRRKQST